MKRRLPLLQAALVGVMAFVIVASMLVPVSCAIRTSSPVQTRCSAFFGKSYSATGPRSPVIWPAWPLATSLAVATLAAALTYRWIRRD
jgi:hypothetical protein